MCGPWKKAVFALTLLGIHSLALLASTYDLHAHAHTLCPEHGEVIHGQDVHAPIAESEYSLLAGHSPQHDHCALAPHFRPETARVSLPALHSIDTTHSSLRAVAVENPRRDSEARYRLAPKNSPPS